jgi:hypothetical protein
MVSKVREVVCPVLESREKNRTFIKVEGEKMNFFSFTFDIGQ